MRDVHTWLKAGRGVDYRKPRGDAIRPHTSVPLVLREYPTVEKTVEEKSTIELASHNSMIATGNTVTEVWATSSRDEQFEPSGGTITVKETMQQASGENDQPTNDSTMLIVNKGLTSNSWKRRAREGPVKNISSTMREGLDVDVGLGVKRVNEPDISSNIWESNTKERKLAAVEAGETSDHNFISAEAALQPRRAL